MVRAREALAGGLLGLALLLSACSGDPAPKIPEIQASTSPSPSAAAARSPEQTVRAWVDARNDALVSGHTKAVRQLSSHSCVTCTRLITPIEQIYRQGGHFETAGWRVLRSRAKPPSGAERVVIATVLIAGGRTFLAEGADPNAYPAETHRMTFKTSQSDSRSKVTFVGFIS